MLTATSLDEQRRLFNETLAPMFDTKLVRWMCRLPVSLYGLGIPPAQFAYLNAQAQGNVAGPAEGPAGAAGLRFSDGGQLFRLAGLRPRL